MLAEEFAAHGYDVKWLLREIALSKTYQRSSEAPATAVPEHRYASALLKPLSPEQLGYAMTQASGMTDALRLELAKNLTEPALQAKLAPYTKPFRHYYGTRAGEPEEGFVSTLDQTLFVKHGYHIQNLVAARNGSLVDRASKLTENSLVAEELYLSVYTRMPTDEERKEIADLLTPGASRSAVLHEIVWAMLASSEFRFNH